MKIDVAVAIHGNFFEPGREKLEKQIEKIVGIPANGKGYDLMSHTRDLCFNVDAGKWPAIKKKLSKLPNVTAESLNL